MSSASILLFFATCEARPPATPKPTGYGADVRRCSGFARDFRGIGDKLTSNAPIDSAQSDGSGAAAAVGRQDIRIKATNPLLMH